MQLEQFYSSSSSNSYAVTASDGRRLLIECGVRWPKLQFALGYDLSNISGCLLTHEHKDHSKAVYDVMQAGINVYGSEGTLKALGVELERRAITLEKNALPYCHMADFNVRCFEAHHDAVDPLIYVIKCDDELLLFATDTCYITQKFGCYFNIIAIECSYDAEILQERVDRKDINETLAKRLLTSHMSKQNAMRYLADYCDLRKCREIHLLHMSADNLDKEQTRKEFEERFFIEVKVHGCSTKAKL